MVREDVDQRGVDVVIESSGAPAAIESTTDAVRRGGTIVLVGIPHDADIPASVVEAINGEYDFVGSYRFANTYPDAIRGIQTGTYDVDGLVSFEEPFERIGAAFDRAAAADSMKGVVRVGD